ncbi:glycosyltransferase [Salimicrobium sp. PL1-032A]|uniref:glycosyltransferase n=1 Tax=Salimicrobium sp. PL1-032A TaxID=3095364 RepID=UPI003261BAD6
MDKIAVFSTTDRNIPFNDIIPYFSVESKEVEDIPTLSNHKLVILDFMDWEKCLEVSGKIREHDAKIPLLLIACPTAIVDYSRLKEIPGSGPVKVLRWRVRLTDELWEGIQAILHPEYPSKPKNIVFILPIFNESERFEHVKDFLDQLHFLLELGYTNTSVHLINDGSVDNSQQLIQDYYEYFNQSSTIIPSVRLLSSRGLNQNTRKAGTYIEGMKHIEAEYYIFVDADNSFKLEDIVRMINIVQTGYYDMVIGSKDFSSEKRSPIRHILSFGKRTLTRHFLPGKVYDSQTGLKMMNRTAVDVLLPELHLETGLAIDLEILYLAKRKNLRVLQTPVECIDREGSHINAWKDSIQFLKSMGRILRYHRST